MNWRRITSVILAAVVWQGVAGFPSVAVESRAAPGAGGTGNGDWPNFRGNPLQTGVASSQLPDKLEILWSFKTKDSVEGTAAIAGGTVYVGSFDEHLYALDLKTGQQRWQFKSGPIKVAPAVANGAVYVGNTDGVFYCLDAATGAPRWKFDTEVEITSSANFAGDTVLFGAGDETLYCLSLEGKKRWTFKVPGGPVLGSPAVVGKRTFVSGCDSSLHVLDLTNGKELASVNLDGQTGATVAVKEDRLYVGTMTHQVLAIDWKKAEVAWRFEAAKNQKEFFSSAAVTDALVVIGSRDKRVYGLDRQTGKEVWSFATRDRVDSSPVVVGTRVFVGSYDGNLYELDLRKGTEIKKFKLGREIVASPAVGENCLVIGTTDGVVYCLGAKK
jgi:outer membrane protein assembly factor BamB